MFALVLIAILNTGEVVAHNFGMGSSMEACFEAREKILAEVHRDNDGTITAVQGVCLQIL